MFRVSVLVLGFFLGSARLSTAVENQSTTIYRDEFGIPRIFAPTLEDASYAVGYAQAEDRLEELLKNDRRASGTMAEVFGPAAVKVTGEQAIAIAFSTQVWHAERWQTRLEQAWNHAKDAEQGGDTAQVFDLIRSWNRRADPDSHGALAYYGFKKALGGEVGRATEPPANLTDEQLLTALRKSAERIKALFGEVAVPGRYFRVGRRGGNLARATTRKAVTGTTRPRGSSARARPFAPTFCDPTS